MKRYSIFYFIGQSIKSLWRNRAMTLASIAVLMSCLVVVGGFALLVVNINVNMDNMNMLNEIVVFTEIDATEEEVLSVKAELETIEGVEIEHITKAQALEQMKQDAGEYSYLYDEITEENNPLTDSFVITYSDEVDVDTLAYQLEHTAGIRKVNNRSDLAGMMSQLKNAMTMIFMWFLVILFVVSLFVIINTIKIAVFARRNEISVMRYVGATNWFITMPFVFEGIIIGAFSGALAFFVEWYVYRYVENMISIDLRTIIQILAFDQVKVYLIIGFIAVGIFTGIVGSVISLRKYLKA